MLFIKLLFSERTASYISLIYRTRQGKPEPFIPSQERGLEEGEISVRVGDIFHPFLSLDLFGTSVRQIAGVGFFLGFFASLFFLC